LADTIAPGTSV